MAPPNLLRVRTSTTLFYLWDASSLWKGELAGAVACAIPALVSLPRMASANAMDELRMRRFLHAMPKADLHLHLDGSLRLETLLELAQEQGVALPASDAAGLRALVFPPSYTDLGAYLEGFRWTTAVLRATDALRRVARELAEDCFAENVHYAEVRFAPQLHAHDGLSALEAVRSVAYLAYKRKETRSLFWERGSSSS